MTPQPTFEIAFLIEGLVKYAFATDGHIYNLQTGRQLQETSYDGRRGYWFGKIFLNKGELQTMKIRPEPPAESVVRFAPREQFDFESDIDSEDLLNMRIESLFEAYLFCMRQGQLFPEEMLRDRQNDLGNKITDALQLQKQFRAQLTD